MELEFYYNRYHWVLQDDCIIYKKKQYSLSDLNSAVFLEGVGSFAPPQIRLEFNSKRWPVSLPFNRSEYNRGREAYKHIESFLQKNSSSNLDKKSKRAWELIERGSLKYQETFSMLSLKQIDVLISTFTFIITRLESKQIPHEVYMVVVALKRIKDDENYSNCEDSEITGIIDSFKLWIEAMLGVSNDYLKQAGNKGLDFGILTNSATNAALYSVMDQLERNKNKSIANMNISKDVYNRVIELKNSIDSVGTNK